MNLQRKLLTIFGGLALLALSTAGVTLWSVAQWSRTEEQLQNHYQRSLLLQRIRAATFRAFKEVPDAIATNDADAPAEFRTALQPVESDFQQWEALADTAAEKQQVQEVRAAYTRLIQDAQTIFELVQTGQRQAALDLMEGRLETQDFQRFEQVTGQAAASDQAYRQVIRARTQNTRQTAQLVLAIAAFGVLSLILLLAAYLASDLFAPLREAEDALDDVARGNLRRRLSEDRQDELGAIHRAFNQMVAAIAQREQLLGLTAVPAQAMNPEAEEANWQDLPSRLALHTLVSQLRSRVNHLNQAQVSLSENGRAENGRGGVTTADKQALIQQLDQLSQAIARITEFGFPLDLNLARTDIRTLLYEVLVRFHEDFVQRNVSYELQIAPNVGQALVDRLKLREVLGELVRNALTALPEQGGQIGIRAALNGDETELLIEVADNGRGVEQPLLDQALDPLEVPQDHRPSVGLKLTKAIVEQHGGRLVVDSEINQGTYVQIRLPLRTRA